MISFGVFIKVNKNSAEKKPTRVKIIPPIIPNVMAV